MKKLLTIALLTLAVVGLGYAVKKRLAAVATPIPPNAQVIADAQLPANGIVVTYFTSDVRCPSCMKIEALTRQTLESRFPGQLASGTVVFRTLNIDRPENKHFVQDYNLVSKTVIVSARENGRETHFENLQDVWLKLGDPVDFENYVAAAIK